MFQATPVPDVIRGVVHRLAHLIAIGIRADTEEHREEARPGVKAVWRWLPNNPAWAAALPTMYDVRNRCMPHMLTTTLVVPSP